MHMRLRLGKSERVAAVTFVPSRESRGKSECLSWVHGVSENGPRLKFLQMGLKGDRRGGICRKNSQGNGIAFKQNNSLKGLGREKEISSCRL